METDPESRAEMLLRVANHPLLPIHPVMEPHELIDRPELNRNQPALERELLYSETPETGSQREHAFSFLRHDAC